MVRKTCRVSLRKRISKPLMICRRNDGTVTLSKKKNTTSSKKRKSAIVAGINKSTKKKAREKERRRQVDKLKRVCDSNALRNNQSSGSLFRSPATLKSTRKNHQVALGKKNTTDSRDFDSDVGDAETIGEASQSQSAISAVIQKEHTDVERVPGFTAATNDFPKSWTDEMIKYYFEPDEKRKSFDYAKIMENIEYKASDWWISDADRTDSRRKREFFQRCAKCNRKGHTKNECKKHAVCYVCGEFNHGYSECPNAVCFTCGRSTKKYADNCRQCRKMLNNRKTCTLCGQIWHEETLCPSNWRKYSLMARSTCDSVIRLNSRKCCYNCAQRGHFGFECPRALQTDYPPENPLKTAFPLEQRRYISGSDGGGDGDGNSPRIHIIFITEQTSKILCSEIGKRFLTNLSRNTNIRIELFCGKRCYIKLFGDLKVVDYCKCQLLEWQT